MGMVNEIPDILPANGHDRSNYIPKRFNSNMEINAVVSFDQSLDEDVLKKAVRLSLDAEPVLGCRFIEDEQPYWRRFEEPDEIMWFEFVKSDNKQEAAGRFLKSTFAHDGQQIKVRLIRSRDKDTLCVKISHACSDAAGLKQYLEILAGIYSKLQENGGFKPMPNQDRRDQKHYFDAMGVAEPLALFDPYTYFVKPTWAFPHHALEYEEMSISIRRINDEAYDRIKEFAKTQGVTVNTTLATAFVRSLFELVKPPVGEEMAICVTIDLRGTYTSDTNQAVCNMSVSILPKISRIEKESFKGTLKRVSYSIDELKRTRAHILNAVALEVLGSIDFSKALGQMEGIFQWINKTRKSHPILSNMGIINTLKFGQIIAADAYLVTPTSGAPAFLLGASTYNKTLTLDVSYYRPAHKKEDIEKFMDLMEKELSSL